MILPAQHIRRLCVKGWVVPPSETMQELIAIGNGSSECTLTVMKMIEPFTERGVYEGMSYGLGPATYDFRIGQDLTLEPHGYSLASTVERVAMPHNVRATVCDKSSWARKFLFVQNTKIDPGFIGHITLELTNQSNEHIAIKKGMPVCQLEFAYLVEDTDMPYRGKYQNQGAEPVPARYAKDVWS